jgi:ATP-binding cassette subfamily B multidrug efflux pump
VKSLSVVNRHIWKYKKLLLLGGLIVLISNILGLYPPQVVRHAINLVQDLIQLNSLHDGFEVKGHIGSLIAVALLVFAGLVLGFALLRGLFLFFSRQTLIVLSRKVEFDQRNDIYNHYQELTLSFYRRNRTGDLMARISEDIGHVRMYVGPGIMYSLNTISLAVIVIVAMLMVNPELTLYTIAPLPLLSLLIYLVENKVLKRSERIQQQLSRLTAFTQEIFSGIRVAKAYSRERDFGVKFEQESNQYRSKAMSLVRINSLFFPLVLFLVGLSTALTVWIGAEKVVEGSLTVGNIAEFTIYVGMLTWPIISIGWVSSLIQRAAASQKRINEVMDEKPDMQFPASSQGVGKAHIVFKDVSFKYPATGIQALDHVSFEILPGQKIGILGSTGSGKSTLCTLIPRLLDVDSGEIIIDGLPIKEYGRNELRGAIGYAPQDVFLFSEKISENIAFGMPGASESQVQLAAERAGILENILDFPDKFETVVGERGVTLSGGQKQRIALARAMIREPKILILDDSLSAVDTKTEELILQNLRQARISKPEMAILMVSHRISTIQDSDLILVMDNGKVIEQGTHNELIAKDGYYALIQKKQLIEEELGTVAVRNN